MGGNGERSLMARWRVVVEILGEYPDAHAARMEAFRLYGGLVNRVVSAPSDEIGQEEARTARRQRTLRFVDLDAEEEA